MAGQQVRLRKRCGGNTITWEDHEYHWPVDDPVIAVPYEMAMGLLAIPDGGYSVEGDPAPLAASSASPGGVQSAHTAGLGGSEEGAEEDSAPWDEDGDEGREVTEPAPDGEHKVTEPAPPPDQPATAVTQRAKAGTQRRPAARGAARKPAAGK